MKKSSITNNTLPPFRPSGIRLGTPAITTRGLIEKDMKTITEWVKQAIDAREDESRLAELRKEVKTFALQSLLPSDKLGVHVKW